MHIDPLEKVWAWISVLLAISVAGILTFYAIANNVHPPSNVETVDSASLHLGGEFAEENLGVKEHSDGSVTVTMVGARYGFYPRQIEVPVNTPVKFRIASFDVLHGLHAPYTNLATMVVPGYVSEVNTVFPKEGEYPIFCNEYCGLGHDEMWSRLVVVAKSGG